MRLIEFFTAQNIVRYAKRGDEIKKQPVRQTDLRPRVQFSLRPGKQK